MRIINIVDELSGVNFGIWNAAVAPGNYLYRQYGIESQLWYPQTDFKADFSAYVGLTPIALPDTQIRTLHQFLKQGLIQPKKDVIVTHGTWRYPTHWGAALKKIGFKWMYVPHGMLEPWSLAHKKWKKFFYFHLIEKRLAQKADVVRAVGYPEYVNLKKHFSRVEHIPNGVPDLELDNLNKNYPPFTCLFMARLHMKKGIIPLVEAWKESKLCNNENFVLKIAGPDDGQLEKLQTLLTADVNNVQYLGPKFGTEKAKLLEKAHFYFLPSISEGFPTSVVEAMQYGAIPFISSGCNFPEAFDAQVAFEVGIDKNSLIQTCNMLASNAELIFTSNTGKVQQYANTNYTNSRIATLLYNQVQKLLLA